MEIIGPDCEKIILNYKKSFDFIVNQRNEIIHLLNNEWHKYNFRNNEVGNYRYYDTPKNITIKTDIDYEDFKEIYLTENRNNKKIMFTINCYGSGHYMNRKIFDLDLDYDKDEMLYEFRIININKNTKKNTILIDLYNKKYDNAEMRV